MISKLSYLPLWHVLVDKGMSKKDLQEKSGVSAATISKLRRGDNVTADVLLRICSALECDIADICTVMPTEILKETIND